MGRWSVIMRIFKKTDSPLALNVNISNFAENTEYIEIFYILILNKI